MKMKMISGIAAITALVFLVPATSVTLAKNGKGDASRPEIEKNSIALRIGQSGDVQLDGLRVTSINGVTVTGTVAWPSGIMAWTVVTSADTKFSDKSDVRAGIGSLAVGDTVSVHGMLAGTTPFSVRAERVRILKNVDKARTTVQGKLVSLASTTLPTSLVLRVNDVDYSVRLASDTLVLNSLWVRTSLLNFRIGDTIRAYGVVDAGARTVDATVVRNTAQ